MNSARRSDDGFPLFRRTLCSLRVLLSPPKKSRFVTSAFCCPQQSSVRRSRTPYGGTSDFVTADAHGKAPGGIPVRIFVDAPPYGSVGATALRPVCATVCLSVRYSVALCAPYESVCFHQSKPKTNHYQVEVVLVFSFLISSFYFQALKNAVITNKNGA